MPEISPTITRTDQAQLVDLNFAKTARARALREASKTHVDPDHTSDYVESRLLMGIASNLFGEDSENLIGDRLSLKYGLGDQVFGRVQEEFDEGTTTLTTLISPDEYEWLTVNMDFYDEKEQLSSRFGDLLGRYYRLTLLTNYLLGSRGFPNYKHPSLRGKEEIGGILVDLSAPTQKPLETRHDRARLRIAGGFALAAIQSDQEETLRNYLRFSIDDRMAYVKNTVRFAVNVGCAIPQDINQELHHWQGVCLPLSAAQTEDKTLWQRDSSTFISSK